MQARSLRFAATARALGDAARAHGFASPAFRSPPRVEGRARTIRRHPNGSATVSLVVRERPWSAVVADMIEGFVAVNPQVDDAAELRDLLWATIEHIELPSAATAPTDTGTDIGSDSGKEANLQVVSSAA